MHLWLQLVWRLWVGGSWSTLSEQQLKQKTDWDMAQVVECLPSEGLSSNPNTTKKTTKTKLKI
jgi:hypothetical protein